MLLLTARKEAEMPAGSSTTRILYRLNKVCEDLSWQKEPPHYAEVKKSGHFDDMTLCECQLWASIGPEMAAHVWADMSRDDREAIRAGGGRGGGRERHVSAVEARW